MEPRLERRRFVVAGRRAIASGSCPTGKREERGPDQCGRAATWAFLLVSESIVGASLFLKVDPWIRTMTFMRVFLLAALDVPTLR